MADLMIDGNASSFRIRIGAVRVVVKASGLVFEDIFGISEHQIIEVLGGDAGFNKRFNVVENQSRIAAGRPDAFDLFRGLNKNIVKH